MVSQTTRRIVVQSMLQDLKQLQSTHVKWVPRSEHKRNSEAERAALAQRERDVEDAKHRLEFYRTHGELRTSRAGQIILIGGETK